MEKTTITVIDENCFSKNVETINDESGGYGCSSLTLTYDQLQKEDFLAIGQDVFEHFKKLPYKSQKIALQLINDYFGH